MTVPTDEIISKVVDLQASVRALESLCDEDRLEASLLLASFFMEYAAFEMAVNRSAQEVSEMIIMAAKLERAAKSFACKRAEDDDAQIVRT